MTAPRPVFLCSPTHNGQMHQLSAKAFFQDASNEHAILPAYGSSSLLAFGFNTLYCQALNARSKYPTMKWFAMLHADVAPESFWLDKLIRIAEESNADALGCIIPFKDPSGLTSTAIAPEGQKYGAFRLTMTQALAPEIPATIGTAEVRELMLRGMLPQIENPVLLINTGCMIIRIDQHWSDEIYFNISDRITKDPYNRTYQAETEPEDWFVSKLLHSKGAKVMATRSVKVSHLGGGNFPNDKVWGYASDPNINPVIT